jgi:hypothetical protein
MFAAKSFFGDHGPVLRLLPGQVLEQAGFADFCNKGSVTTEEFAATQM